MEEFARSVPAIKMPGAARRARLGLPFNPSQQLFGHKRTDIIIRRCLNLRRCSTDVSHHLPSNSRYLGKVCGHSAQQGHEVVGRCGLT